ncbi:peptidylprolyl isomerase [Roseisalinus antarcticus]|uniref:Parvulin-like PPIase n=1 Tax=Roseisalinus antarcticus TaxID=254357 RepID=A0A1Y5RFD7_9RHOB|nr:peptidyl-prolyl cis-trans isomerase [Roseisalinus antarcticus]SLN16190.1 Peptidyl-prolyl cis-trans isomerase D [Roseisalinus antarcticus]
MAKQAAKKTATWIILGLLLFGLAGFGATSFGGNITSLGRVGDQEVSTTAYARELNSQIRAFEAQTGQPLSFPQAQAFGLDRTVLSRLISTKSLDNEAASLGISVGDARIADEIMAIPQFQGTAGNFDRQAYSFALERNGLTETEFETDLRQQLSRTLLQSGVVSAIPEPEGYGTTLATFLAETRNFLWVALTEDDLQSPVADPTDAQLQAYYDANTDRFMSPETREITFARLTPEMIMDEVSVDEDALRALYDERIDEYVRPERRLVERLVFRDADQAEAARARLADEDLDFDALVRERGLHLADIDLGDVSEADLGEAGAAVFATATGDVTDPQPSEFGPALYRVNAVLRAQETTFEEARGTLREELAAERARRIIDQDAEGMTDLIAGGASIEDLAERTALELGTISYTEDTTSGFAAYAAFREAADAAAPGDFPEILSLEDGGVFALRIDEIRAPAPIPFAQARDDVADAWRRAEVKDRLMGRAETLADEVEAAGDFTAEMPVPTAETGLDRRAFVGDTPPAFMTEVFDMAEGEARRIETPTGAIVVLVTAITPADPEAAAVAEEAARIAAEAQSAITQDIFDVFTRSVQTRTDVRIDQAAVNAVNATFQ